MRQIGNPWHSSNPKIIGGTLSKCPRCGRNYNTPPAISRIDNKTKICPACGVEEAMEDFRGYLKNNHESQDETR